MPPLRTHKKSRLGCLECKKRRVKCDENGPPCGSCAFRKVECIYHNTSTTPPTGATSSRPSHDSPQPQPQAATSPKSPVSHSLPVLDPSNALLLELMHKFSSDTYKSIGMTPSDSLAWQIRIPQLALDFAFLLDGLLSVAALHTAISKDPHKADAYVNIAVEFQTRSLEEFQHAIRNVSSENCAAVFAYSIFTIVHGIVVPELTHTNHAVHESDGSSRLESIFVLFELVQGTTEITKLFGPALRRTFPAGDDYWAGSSNELDEEGTVVFRRLHDLNRLENSGHSEKFQIIETAMSQLKLCWQRYRGHQDSGSVLTWLAIVERDFVKYLRQKEALALLILVQWGFLLGQLDGKVWWASNSGLALVNDGLGILDTGNHIRAPDLAAAWLIYKNVLSSFNYTARPK